MSDGSANKDSALSSSGEALVWLGRSGWQPIDSAPKDSTTLIGYRLKLPERWIRVGLGANLGGEWTWHQDVPWEPATHWMPLPPPPTVGLGRVGDRHETDPDVLTRRDIQADSDVSSPPRRPTGDK